MKISAILFYHRRLLWIIMHNIFGWIQTNVIVTNLTHMSQITVSQGDASVLYLGHMTLFKANKKQPCFSSPWASFRTSRIKKPPKNFLSFVQTCLAGGSVLLLQWGISWSMHPVCRSGGFKSGGRNWGFLPILWQVVWWETRFFFGPASISHVILLWRSAHALLLGIHRHLETGNSTRSKVLHFTNFPFSCARVAK